MPGCSRCKRRGTRRCPRPWRPPMTELVIAALMTAVVTYGMSATAKLRSGQAYRAFRAGLAATALVSRPLTGPVGAAPAGGEAEDGAALPSLPRRAPPHGTG